MEFPFPLTPEEVGGGKLIGFVSAVPGAGSSTLACLAALSCAEANEVALADLNPSSKVRSYMGLTPDVCPASILDVAGVVSPGEISRVSVSHPRKVMVLPGISRPLDAAQVDTVVTIRTLTLLKKNYPLSLAVLAPLYTTGWAGALVCDTLCLVLRPDRTDLDSFKEQMELLSRLGCGERVKIILNQTGVPGGLKDAEVKEIFKPDKTIPYDSAIRAANNKRYPSPGKLKKVMLELVKGGDS